MNKIGLLEVNSVLPEMEIIQVRIICSIVDNALSRITAPGGSLWRHLHAGQEPLLSGRRRHRHCAVDASVRHRGQCGPHGYYKPNNTTVCRVCSHCC